MRKPSMKAVTFTLEIEPEDIPVEGNAMASGDDSADRECEAEILERLDRGDLWAWCYVRVTATWGEFSGSDGLGECSYRSEADFKRGGYWEDMRAEAYDRLCEAIERANEERTVEARIRGEV